MVGFMEKYQGEPLFSIVVPAYNVVEYLDETIRSVISQWNEKWELIIVNDGATDGARSLLDEYQSKLNSDRFIVLHKENGGVASARNAGTILAKGKYVIYLDGDDVFEKNALKLIENCITENQPDCLIYDFNYYWDDGGFYGNEQHKGIPQRKIFSYSEDVLANVYQTSQLYLWKHAFKKDILIKHLAPEGRNFEDVSTLPLLISETTSLYYLPLKLVKYRQRNGSIMKVKSRKNILDLSSSLHGVTEGLKLKYNNQVPNLLKTEHSIFNLYVFTWACGDTLSNKDLNPRELYPIFVDNFHRANLVDLEDLKTAMQRDMKNWRKFILFYKYPELFYLAFKLRHKYNRLYRGLNKLREFIYKT